MGEYFKQSKQVITRHEGGATLVFEQSTGAICILNPTSEFIWQRCDGQFSPEDIAEGLESEFKVDDSSQAGSLSELVRRHLKLLQKAKLVEPAAAA